MSKVSIAKVENYKVKEAVKKAMELANYAKYIKKIPLLLCIILSVGLFLRLWNITRNGIFYDEGVFLEGGHEIIQGKILYEDFFDHKPPAIYYLNALLFSIFGEFYIIPRLISVIFSTFTIFLVYLCGKEILSKKAGLIASFLFALDPLSVMWSSYVITDTFMTTMAVVATLFFIKSQKKERIGGAKNIFIFLCGFFVGIGFLFKQPAILILVGCGLYLLLNQGMNIRNILRKSLIKDFTLLFIGFALAMLPVLIWINKYDLFNDFFYYVFLYNTQIKPVSVAGKVLCFLSVVYSNWFLWCLGLMSFIRDLSEKKLLSIPFILALVSIIFCFLSVAVFSLYYLLVIPFLCLFAAPTLTNIMDWFSSEYRKLGIFNLFRSSIILFISIILLFAGAYMIVGGLDLDRSFYTSSIETVNNVADYINTHTEKDEKVFSPDPIYPFLAGREPAYMLYILHTTADVVGTDDLPEYLESNRIRYLILPNIPGSRPKRIFSDTTLEYIQHHYHKEKTIEMVTILKRN